MAVLGVRPKIARMETDGLGGYCRGLGKRYRGSEQGGGHGRADPGYFEEGAYGTG